MPEHQGQILSVLNKQGHVVTRLLPRPPLSSLTNVLSCYPEHLSQAIDMLLSYQKHGGPPDSTLLHLDAALSVSSVSSISPYTQGMQGEQDNK